MRYPIVLFDIGETLVGPRRSYGTVYSAVLRKLGVDRPPRELDEAIRRTAAELARRVPPGADRFGHFDGGERGYWERFVAGTLRHATGTPPDPRLVRRARRMLSGAFCRPSAWRVYDDVIPTLDRLVEAGCRLGVVSNWDSRLPEILSRLALDGYFESLAVSHLEGVEKPSPELFRRVLNRMEAAADDALHVGNVAELDLAGARAAGVAGVLIDRSGRRDASDVVASLTEIPRIAARGFRR